MIASIDPLIAVQRAVAEFRHGRPVLIEAEGAVVLAAPAELAAESLLAELREDAGEALLALTETRARALNIKPSGYNVVLIKLDPWLRIDAVHGLADATTDLQQPLRGPFRREKRRPGAPVEMAIQLAKHARLLPAALVWEPDPVAARAVCTARGWLRLTADAIRNYESEAAGRLTEITAAQVPLADALRSRIIAFRPADGGIEHLAIVVGQIKTTAPVLVRLHSECFTGDLLGSMKCDCGEQLRGAIREIEAGGGGVLLYLAQEGRGIGLINKLRAYRLQQDGFDTVDANLRLGFHADERIFRPAAEMLRRLGVHTVRLMTNNPDKVAGLEACGITVAERKEHAFPANKHNEFYLDTKRKRSGHLL